MRYLFLTSMLLLSAVAAFAQNSAVVAQNGTANSASALQGGSSLTATISQVGS
ncbi:MAG: curlin repeat-containing protein, partial [Spirosoma sp.]|nr:curlin repeat-containing protein [Spirosoma sp.]